MHVGHVGSLFIKELRSLGRDPVMLILIVYAFTFGVYTAATAVPESLHQAPISIVDEDHSPLSRSIADAFYPPLFMRPVTTTQAEMDKRLDAGRDTFALDIPPDFERDVVAGRQPTIQLNVDATRMSQAFTGSAYIHAIINDTVAEFFGGRHNVNAPGVGLALRALFNPNLNQAWFGSVMEIINNITILAIVLSGAALIREREHGTIEHLLAMPLTPLEIMTSKVLAMVSVVLLASTLSLIVVVEGVLAVPIAGAPWLFLSGAGLNLFATAAMGIFLATIARSMPQFGLLLILVMLPLEMLSGGSTPRESMPELVQWLMLAAPTTHFVALSQAVLFRGAGIDVVWPQFVALAAIGAALFGLSLHRFRRTIATMG